jgi:hypothetical protein
MIIAFRLIATDIHSPITMEEIEHAKAVYPLNGFPGCMGIVLMVFILLGNVLQLVYIQGVKGRRDTQSLHSMW